MLLRELTDTSYPFKHHTVTSGENTIEQYNFSNDAVDVRTDILVTSKEYKMRNLVLPNHFDVMFATRDKAVKDGVIRMGSYWMDKVTNKGDAFKILSTIVKIMKDVIERHPDVNHLMFAAKEDESSRVKLYSRFVDSVSRYMPGWKLIKVIKGASTPSTISNNNTIFILEKSS